MRAHTATGEPLTPGVNVDPVDIARGLRQAAALGYGDTEAQMVATYCIQRWQRGEDAGAEQTWTGYYPSDFTAWRVILAAAVSTEPLDPARFPPEYKAKMVAAYPVIAGLSGADAWTASVEEREAAFGRVLAARNLRRTHELYLQDRRTS